YAELHGYLHYSHLLLHDALPISDPETALDPDTPLIHPELGDNLVFGTKIEAGDIDRACAEADLVVEDVFHFGRHTGVTLEPRALDRKSTRLNSSHVKISYAVFCL